MVSFFKSFLLVNLYRDRQTVISKRPESVTQGIVRELKDSSDEFRQRIDKMEGQMEALLAMVKDLHTKLEK